MTEESEHRERGRGTGNWASDNLLMISHSLLGFCEDRGVNKS